MIEAKQRGNPTDAAKARTFSEGRGIGVVTKGKGGRGRGDRKGVLETARTSNEHNRGTQ